MNNKIANIFSKGNELIEKHQVCTQLAPVSFPLQGTKGQTQGRGGKMNTKNTNNSVEMFYGAGPHLFERAKELRKNETKAEKLLWAALSNKQLGVKFRRQHPLYKFIADFYCHQLKLVIEVDGSVHNSEEAKEYDENRTYLINEFDIEVVRFTNEEVINQIENVVNTIKTIVNKQDNHK